MASFRRFVTIGLPASAMAAGVYYCRDDLQSFAATSVEPHPMMQQQPNYVNTGYFNESYAPVTRWNYNWDNRDPMSLIDQSKYTAASEEEKREMLQKVKPTATRHIFLIRHGQYHFHNDKQNLTDLGREQAILLGKRLASSNIKFDKAVMSTMNRATETAQLMSLQMAKLPTISSDSMLEEGAPYPPEPKHSNWRPMQKFFTEGSRIEAAFRKYVHRASAQQKEDSHELIVCHGNVIRYFVCRALQFPPEGWLRMSIGHTSITWLTVRPNGYVSLRCFGDIGHLPSDKTTFS